MTRALALAALCVVAFAVWEVGRDLHHALRRAW